MSNDDLVGVSVNEDLCIGAGQCEMLEREVFCIDEDTVISGVVGTGILSRERASRVVEVCPSAAISVVEIAVLDESGTDVNDGGGEDE